MYVELRDRTGRAVRGMPDPSGGTFDAAGDFDRFFDETYPGSTADMPLSVLGKVDPYALAEMTADRMSGLFAGSELALPLVSPGSEYQGLLRLRAMAATCVAMPGSTMVWIGD
jgi:hypothetical protein